MRTSDDFFLRRAGAPDGFILPHRLADKPPNTPLLVALSGGADSSLLLYLCVRYAEMSGCRVYAAHLNHGIRGREADRDETFCRAAAEGYGVRILIDRADVPALAQARGISLETAARDARYAFLASVIDRLSADDPDTPLPLLLTAHNADDQLETVLLRLLRGTGTKGLSGIPPIRPFGRTLLVRPLLGCTKADILSACRVRGLTYVNDSTNDADDCTRNRLRHAIIPRLGEIAGDGTPQRAAVRMADAAREDEAFLSAEAARAFTRLTSPDGLSLSGLKELPPALRRRVLLLSYRDAVRRADIHAPDGGFAPVSNGDTLPPDRTLEAVHLGAIDRLLINARIHAEAPLPFGWRAVIRPAQGTQFLVFLPPADPRPVPGDAGNRRQTLAEGDNRWNRQFTIRVEVLPAPAIPAEGGDVFASVVLPASVSEVPLYARARQPGDVILCHGMHKRIKKLLCDNRIPEADRDALPLVCLPSTEEVLWVPAAAVRDGYLPPDEGNALRITVIRREPPAG